jgi:hypothetical protein
MPERATTSSSEYCLLVSYNPAGKINHHGLRFDVSEKGICPWDNEQRTDRIWEAILAIEENILNDRSGRNVEIGVNIRHDKRDKA